MMHQKENSMTGHARYGLDDLPPTDPEALALQKAARIASLRGDARLAADMLNAALAELAAEGLAVGLAVHGPEGARVADFAAGPKWLEVSV